MNDEMTGAMVMSKAGKRGRERTINMVGEGMQNTHNDGTENGKKIR
jgi:hypothetical protein